MGRAQGVPRWIRSDGGSFDPALARRSGVDVGAKMLQSINGRDRLGLLRASPPTGPVPTDASESSSAGFFDWRTREIYPRQAEARITLQKLTRAKCGSLSASTSALTLPKVVSGLCLLPS